MYMYFGSWCNKINEMNSRSSSLSIEHSTWVHYTLCKIFPGTPCMRDDANREWVFKHHVQSDIAKLSQALQSACTHVPFRLWWCLLKMYPVCEVTVWVWIFTGYKILCFLRIELHPWNLILGYICSRDLEMYVCVHLWHRRRSKAHSGGTDVRWNSSDDGVTPISNLAPSYSSRNLLGVVPAPTNDAGSTA